MAIKSFADQRTMRFERGEIDPGFGAPSGVLRRASRILRAIDAAPDLEALRDPPSLAGAELVEGDCVVPIGAGWRLTFRWYHDHAWNVRLEET